MIAFLSVAWHWILARFAAVPGAIYNHLSWAEIRLALSNPTVIGLLIGSGFWLATEVLGRSIPPLLWSYPRTVLAVVFGGIVVALLKRAADGSKVG